MAKISRLDEAKVTLVDYVINSLENGLPDEQVNKELVACLTVAKSIRQPFERYILIEQLEDMLSERSKTPV